uniref:Plastocyanin-like domain-containing protein n=1 Tax=Clastoptera arizonana TaxID=38151 RepID=A0A1B6CMC5_9HEMI
MTIIGTDAQTSQPTKVNALIMSPGERYTVVVNANRNIGSYWIHVRALGLCTHTAARQVAVLHYAGASNQPVSAIPRFNSSANPNTKTFAVSPVNSRCNSSNTNGICVSRLRSVNRAPLNVLRPVPDVQIIWGFGFHFYPNNELYNNDNYHLFLQSPGPVVGSTINGIINNLPPSPLLTQYADIPAGTICDPELQPISQWSNHRECAHVIKLPVNSVVEILIVDTATYDPNGISHAIHLHGYDYYIIEQGVFPDGLQFNQSVQWLKNKLSTRQFGDIPQFPVRKDTLALTSGGYTVVRIYTDNPGFWFFHCHFAYHLDSGMGGVLQVGELSDMIQPPSGFPKCGDFLPSVNLN